MKRWREEQIKDPLAAARRLATRVRSKRFYKEAIAREEDGRFTLFLDGRRAMTPGRKPLAVSDAKIAATIADEWNAQGEDIDPASMPATRLVNSAIDGVEGRMDEVRGEILAYARTDLLYYRAGEPEGLVTQQRERWDPILAWAEKHFGARFILAEGIVHVAQPPAVLEAATGALATFNAPLRLAALHLATTLTGSALIALALAEGAVDEDAAWAAAHADEDWNISRWGEDAEAAAHRAKRRADFHAAAMVMANTPPRA